MNSKQLAMFNLLKHEMEENQFGFNSNDALVVQEVVRILSKYGITATLTQTGFQ